MVTTKLIAEDCSLILDAVNELQWCYIYLEKDRKIRNLGADDKSTICRRFLSILSSNDFFRTKRKFLINNKEYIRFIGLMEKEYAFGYARKKNSGLEIHFRNGKTDKAIATIEISSEECKIWTSKLSS